MWVSGTPDHTSKLVILFMSRNHFAFDAMNVFDVPLSALLTALYWELKTADCTFQ